MKEKMKQVVKEYFKKHPDIEIKKFIRDELAVDISGDVFEPFLWCVYEFGTEIHKLKPDQTENDPQIERLVNDAKSGGEYYGKITECFIGEKGELRRVGFDELLERLETFRRGVDLNFETKLAQVKKRETLSPLNYSMLPKTNGPQRSYTLTDATMELRKVPVSETLSDGTKVFNLNSNAADADFMRTWRLLRRIEKGDESAKKELEALENEPMYYDPTFD